MDTSSGTTSRELSSGSGCRFVECPHHIFYDKAVGRSGRVNWESEAGREIGFCALNIYRPLTRKEVSELYGVSVKTVDNIVEKGLRKLRKIIHEQKEDE